MALVRIEQPSTLSAGAVALIKVHLESYFDKVALISPVNKLSDLQLALQECLVCTDADGMAAVRIFDAMERDATLCPRTVVGTFEPAEELVVMAVHSMKQSIFLVAARISVARRASLARTATRSIEPTEGVL